MLFHIQSGENKIDVDADNIESAYIRAIQFYKRFDLCKSSQFIFGYEDGKNPDTDGYYGLTEMYLEKAGYKKEILSNGVIRYSLSDNQLQEKVKLKRNKKYDESKMLSPMCPKCKIENSSRYVGGSDIVTLWHCKCGCKFTVRENNQ